MSEEKVANNQKKAYKQQVDTDSLASDDQPASLSIALRQNEVEALLEKYFKSDSDRYVFKDHSDHEGSRKRVRSGGNEACPFPESVAAKRIDFFDKFFNE